MSETTSGVDPVTKMVTPPAPKPDAPTEPVLETASIVTVATAILSLIAAFGLPISDDLQAAILGAIAVVAPVVLGLIARNRAWSPRSAGALARAEAYEAVRLAGHRQPPTGGQF